jgi:Ser/Thr protein kinase RdoA (MazF antagonist)
MIRPLSQTLTWSNADCVVPITADDGMVVRSLWADELRRHAAIVELMPGGAWRRTGEAASESQMLVLAGTLHDDVRSYSRGTFIHWPGGHETVLQSEDGCQVLVIEMDGRVPSTLHRVPELRVLRDRTR